ncbi:hypothetical protein LK518_22735, partial [Parabacteroides distasonis]|uniref:hypothetical protein n=1 Tax=Parabacteroides distasonis TaxID=823 RepID=UPI001D12DB79
VLNPSGTLTDSSGGSMVMVRLDISILTCSPASAEAALAPPSALVTTITYSLAVSPSWAVTLQVTRFSPIWRPSLPEITLFALSSVV